MMLQLFFNLLKIKTMKRLLIFFALLMYAGMLQAQCYVTRSGNGFSYMGAPYKFVGVNLRGTHYLTNAEIDAQIQKAVDMKASVIRIFLLNKDKSNTEIMNALNNFLNRVEAKNNRMKVLVSLMHAYNEGWGIGFYLKEDAPYYNGMDLKPDWFRGPFRTHYKPFVKEVVSNFRHDPRIFGWEIGNELHTVNASEMLTFAYEMGELIKSSGARQMVSTGFISASHAINETLDPITALQYVYQSWNGRTSPFDFGNIHSYNLEHLNPVTESCSGANALGKQHYDINWFVNNNFPYIVGEIGFAGALKGEYGCKVYDSNCTWEGTVIPSAATNRKNALSATLTKFFNNKSADGILQWGLMTGGVDNGQGDKCYGIDDLFHSDFTDVFNLYVSWGSTLPAGGAGPCQTCTPVIAQQPVSAKVCSGSSATFSVTPGVGVVNSVNERDPFF
jgi:hypothetical protein